jgi:hypothetical protein
MRSIWPASLAVAVAASAALAQPVNDDCANATVITTLPFTDAQDVSAATTEPGDPVPPCGAAPRSVWYRYTSPAGASLEIDTFGSGYGTVVSVFRGTCGALDFVDCNDNDFDSSDFSDQSRLVVSLTPGEEVLIAVTDDGGAPKDLAFSVQEATVFQVSEHTVEGDRPDVASGQDGTFLVVYARDDPGPSSANEIVARPYCDGGVPLGDAVPVSEVSADLRYPRIARAAENFVVVWPDLTNDRIRGRRVSATGAPLGTEFDVADDDPDYYQVDVAADAAGAFVVVWSEFGADGDDAGVLARRFDETGTAQGAEFLVNTYTTSQQNDPAVASDAAGNFVVVWHSGASGSSDPHQDPAGGVFGQRFDSTGAPVGSEFQVNETTEYRQRFPSVAMDPSGSFVVVWSDAYIYGCNDYCMMARRYDAGGMPQGGEFVVSPGTSSYGYDGGYNYFGDVSMDPSGGFVVAWSKEFVGAFAREFDASGSPLGAPFSVSHLADDYQYHTRVSVADDGDFVVVWDWSPYGSHYDVMGFAQSDAPTCPGPVTVCPAEPLAGCKAPTLDFKGRLAMKDKTPDKGDTLVWKWGRGDQVTPGELGDPLGADTYTYCLYDGDDELVSKGRVTPGGLCGTSNPKECWKALGTPPGAKGYKYADRDGNADGVQKLILKPGDQGKAKAVLKAKGEALDMPSLPLALPATLQLQATNGTCWTAEFRSDGVQKNTEGVVSIKASVPAGPITTSTSSSTTSTTLGSPSGAFVR